MQSDNETVDEIVNKVRSGDYGCAKCGDLCDCPNADKIITSIIDRIEAAHRREVDKLVKSLAVYERISESLSLAKKRIEAEIADKSKVIQELNDVRELNRKCCDENERLNGEVAELRECLKEAVELMDGKPTSRGIARWRKALKGAKYE